MGSQLGSERYHLLKLLGLSSNVLLVGNAVYMDCQKNGDWYCFICVDYLCLDPVLIDLVACRTPSRLGPYCFAIEWL